MSVDRSEAAAIRIRGILIDFGGVITTSPSESFRDFGERVCGDRELPLRLLTTDPIAKRLFVDHEEGRVDHDDFEAGFAARLRAHGVDVVAQGLLADLGHGIRRDPDMAELVSRLRRAGYPTCLVSNSLGRDSYAGYDLPAMFDAVAISGIEGVRKPSRRLYLIGCERLGMQPEEVVMIDDLAMNIDSARRLGMAGIVHRSAADTIRQLEGLVASPLPR